MVVKMKAFNIIMFDYKLNHEKRGIAPSQNKI